VHPSPHGDRDNVRACGFTLAGLAPAAPLDPAPLERAPDNLAKA